MKKHTTGKSKLGKVAVGFYTTSTMPNQDRKRVRKAFKMKNTERKINEAKDILNGLLKVKVYMNLCGIYGAILTILSTPLDSNWKTCLAFLFIISSLHIEVKNNDK